MQQKIFSWQGINQTGTICSGKLAADSKIAAQKQLQQDNITLFQLEETFSWRTIWKKYCSTAIGGRSAWLSEWTTQELSLQKCFTTWWHRLHFDKLIYKLQQHLTHQHHKKQKIKATAINNFALELSTLINANLTLLDALSTLAQNSAEPILAKLIQQIIADLNHGLSLSSCFKKEPRYFDALFCSLIDIGENSGALDVMLNQLVIARTKSAAQKRKIKKALIYPAIVILVATAVTTLLLVFVIPQMQIMFASFNATLPLYTRIIIALAHVCMHYSLVVLLFLVGSSAATLFYRKKYPDFNLICEKIVFRLPLLGSFLQKTVLLRFTSLMALTLKSGSPMLTALQLTASAIPYKIYQQALQTIAEKIRSGASLTEALTMSQLFPNRVLKMIQIGEASGTLPDMLSKLAIWYEGELDYIADNINQLLEPILIIFLGVVVGGIVIGMYLPIFRLGKIM